MFHVCPGCEQWVERFEPDVEAELFRCPRCGTQQQFRFRPFLALLGASGSGKSTVAGEVIRRGAQSVVLDRDILWAPEFDQPQDGYSCSRIVARAGCQPPGSRPRLSM
jgi:hypothetical protein